MIGAYKMQEKGQGKSQTKQENEQETSYRREPM